MDLINLLDYARAAQQSLPEMTAGYFASGARDEITLHNNRAAFEQLALRFRVLAGVAERDMSTTVLGSPVSMPVLVAPTAFQCLAHPDGEQATVRAAGRAGTIMTLSTLATTDVETVVAAASTPVWFQLYVYKDRGLTRALVDRAAAAGCTALVLTADAPVLGTRERDVHNRFHLPIGLTAKNLTAAGHGVVKLDSADSGLAAYVADMLEPGLTWADVEWLRSISDLPVVVKGVVRGDDAARAVDHGAAAVVVSNHGGRQLDTAVATIRALPDVAAAVDGRIEVLLDGGVRRGTDVLKALALGARAVLLGRPVLWGLAVDGEDGAHRVLELLRLELDQAMALCGCPSLEHITADLIV